MKTLNTAAESDALDFFDLLDRKVQEAFREYADTVEAELGPHSPHTPSKPVERLPFKTFGEYRESANSRRAALGLPPLDDPALRVFYDRSPHAKAEANV